MPSSSRSGSSVQQVEVVVEPPKLPDHISESAWVNHVQAQDGEAVVEGILEDVIGNILSKYHNFILNHSAKKFAAKRCKDELVCMLEGRFMFRDAGEPDIATNPLWMTGEEPIPCKLDSRARGSVPFRSNHSRRLKITSENETRIKQTLASRTNSMDTNNNNDNNDNNDNTDDNTEEEDLLTSSYARLSLTSPSSISHMLSPYKVESPETTTPTTTVTSTATITTTTAEETSQTGASSAKAKTPKQNTTKSNPTSSATLKTNSEKPFSSALSKMDQSIARRNAEESKTLAQTRKSASIPKSKTKSKPNQPTTAANQVVPSYSVGAAKVTPKKPTPPSSRPTGSSARTRLDIQKRSSRGAIKT